MTLVYGSVCSGIEAATVAWEPLGWRPAFFSEIDAAPRAILSHHYPRVPLHGDFTTIQDGDYAPIDLLVGGTPCQDFSVAGKRAGLDGDRGNLTLQYALLARRLRPRWMVWENVPGVFSNNGGRDFGAVLACFAGYPDGSAFSVPKGGWGNSGIVPPAGPDCYGLAWRTLDAQYVRVDGYPRAVPQRRRRVFVVGYLGDWRRAAAVLFERACLSGNPAPRREARKDVAPTISARPTGGGGLGTDFDLDGGLIAGCLNGHSEYGAEVPTLRAQGGDAAGGSEALLAVAGTQDAVSGRLLAFGGNDTRGPIEVSTAVNAHGGSHGRQDFESETFVAHALRGEGFDASEDGTGRGTPIVPVVAPATAATLTRGAESSGKGGYAGRRQEDDVNLIAFDTTQITSAGHPLAAEAHAPAIAFDARQSDTIIYGDKTGPLDTGAFSIGVQQGWAVRRLTTTECERLMGMKDGYTAVPAPGRNSTLADGPRYKCLGNSKAVNCVRWIGMRIAAVEAICGELGGDAA